jgi:hypothetical protein
MPKYTVYLTKTVSATVEVEAATMDKAVGECWNAEAMPGNMRYGAFGTQAMVGESEWKILEVIDEDGKVVSD